MHKTVHFRKRLLLLVLVATTSIVATAQQRPTQPPTTGTGAPAAGSTPPQAAPKPGPKPYKDVITDKAQTRKGLFWVHKLDDKYFFEIGDSLIGRDILVVNRIVKAPIDTRSGFFGFAGDEINVNVIRFEKGPNN